MSNRNLILRSAGYCLSAAFLLAVGTSGITFAAPPEGKPPAQAQQAGNIVLKTMGGFAYSGTVLSNPAGQTVHCDHGYAEYFVPVAARKLPIIMWHSASANGWQTAFDGREGWQPIFLRRQFTVYLIDLPRQGRANWGCELPNDPVAIGRDQQSFISFRMGTWTVPGDPVFFPNIQADLTDRDEFLNQMLRARYPELNGPAEEQFESDAVSELLERTGPAILMPHSGGSRRAFWTALKSSNVAGIVAIEGSQLFPQGEAPDPASVTVPEAEFMKLTKFPILIILGDYLDISAAGQLNIARAKAFVESVNSRGGNAELLYLPERGIFGNTHFSQSDLNNVQVADFVSEFLKKNGLDKK